MRQRDRYLPGLGVDLRIGYSHLVQNGTRLGARETLDHAQLLANRSALDATGSGAGSDPTLVVVIRGFHHQRVAFPMASRISVPLADACIEMRASVDGN